MDQLKNEFNAFKEQQMELNQSVIQRLNSIEAGNQSMRRQTEEYNGTISTVVPIQSIRNELVAFEGRIRILEGLNQSLDLQVIS